jgi:hypothetical protein
MKSNHHLRELIESIKKTNEMITLHKKAGGSSLIVKQYEDIKAKQISELIHGLAISPYQKIESISVIKNILNKFYPDIPSDVVKLEELKELKDAI